VAGGQGFATRGDTPLPFDGHGARDLQSRHSSKAV